MTNYNIIIIAITVAISVLSFRNQSLIGKLTLNPYAMFKKNEWYRIITHGFIHKDIMHLVINMFVLYSFGRYVEALLGGTNYIILYIGALIFSSVHDLYKKKDSYLYNSLGASGAVSAVVFASILFSPWSKIYLMAIIPIPSILFAVGYLWYENYSSSRDRDSNINHQAHIWGAVFGILYPLVIKQGLFAYFIEQLLNPKF